MSVSTTGTYKQYTPDNSTVTLPYDFKIFAETDIEAYLVTLAGVEQLQVLGTNYSVTGVGNESGGNVVFTTAPQAATHGLAHIQRTSPRTQNLDLVEDGDIPADNTEDRLDKNVMLTQEVESALRRTLRLKKSTENVDVVLPDFVASTYLKINATADGITLESAVAPAAATVTPYMETLLDDSNAKEAVATLMPGMIVPGMTWNLDITFAAGTMTITGTGGTALSAANPGYVAVESTSPGQTVILKVTTPLQLLNDDSHASSSLTGYGFGITKTVNWADPMPFFLGVVNRGNSDIDGNNGNSSFFVTRRHCMSKTPSAANDIGDRFAAPANDDQYAIMLLANYTPADYVNLPVSLIGAIRMVYAVGTTDWTIQALNTNDGIGPDRLVNTMGAIYDMPLEQMGAATGTFMLANGGTAPLFDENVFEYSLSPDGFVTCQFRVFGDGGQDGVGAVQALMSAPYEFDDDSSLFAIAGAAVADSIVTGIQNVLVEIQNGNASINFHETAGTVMENGDFTNGARRLQGFITYRAYHPTH